MSTTAQQVFEQTVYLMGEACPGTGLADYSDTQDYKIRALPILNILRRECADRILDGEGAECPEITDFESPLPLDDPICQGVLPYGLAAHLLLEENPASASWFQQKYAELLREARRCRPVAAQGIEDIYGGIEHGKFGGWS